MLDLADMAARMGLALSGRELDQFARYENLLLVWNQRMNLTAIVEPVEIRRRHFLDALTCITVTGDLSGKSLVDVGTGAGFPGLPLKIHFPALELTLVESQQKKARFLAEVIEQLGLEKVTVLNERAETVGQDPQHREQYDWALARSVAALRILMEYLLPLCSVGGCALAQKGNAATTELAEAQSAIQLLGGGEQTVYPVQLPGREQMHYLVAVRKQNPTPDRYPRRPGMPAKRPL